MANYETRIPPQNLDAERSVLCLEIIDPSGYAITAARSEVEPDEFYSDVHGTIHKAILAIADRDEPVTILTLESQLTVEGKLEEIGGRAYLIELTGAIYLGPHAAYHARLVSRAAKKRRMITFAKTILESSYDETKEPEEVFESASNQLTQAGKNIIRTKNVPTSLRDHQLKVAEKYGRGEKPTRFIGIDQLDDALSGVARGENVVIAGATSHGKTLTALQWLQCSAAHGVPSMIISKEMRGAELADRTLNIVTGLHRNEYHQANELLTADINRFYEHRAPITVFEDCDTIDDVERAIEIGVREFGVEVVALDYLQLIKGEGQNREQQVASVSRRWKQACLKHNVIGLCLAQINREASKLSRKPTLSDLRESGAIEQDADVVVFVYWEAKHNAASSPYLYRLLIAKTRQRGAKVPEVEMRIDPARQWLFPCEQSQPEDPSDRFGA